MVSKNGVPYSDDVSMFSQESSKLPSNLNSFDLFLGELFLMETVIRSTVNVKNT